MGGEFEGNLEGISPAFRRAHRTEVTLKEGRKEREEKGREGKRGKEGEEGKRRKKRKKREKREEGEEEGKRRKREGAREGAEGEKKGGLPGWERAALQSYWAAESGSLGFKSRESRREAAATGGVSGRGV